MIKKITLKKLFILLLPFILLTVSHAISATQSSTGYGGTADKAIDGNTDGNYWNYSVTHTLGLTHYDWILIDLESVKAINSITLWNRTNSYTRRRLRNVRIMLSKTPFTPATTASGLQKARDISIWEDRAPNNTIGVTKIPFNPNGVHARYILIQKTGPYDNYTPYLSLAEVQIDANALPIADAGTDQLVNLGDSVTLDASGSSDNDGNIVSYLWTEGSATLSTSQNFVLTSLSAGTHTITLTVTDNQGATDTDTMTITVNTPPIANAGHDQNVLLGEEVTLDGSASSDDDLNSMRYTWTQGGNTIATGISPTVTFSTAGTYTVTLTVTDKHGLTSSDDVVIRVNTAPVVEDMNFTILKNSSVSFALTATDADGDTIVSYPIVNPPEHGSLKGPENNITYSPSSNYTGIDTFTYKAYDGKNDSNVATVTITIVPPATAVHDDYNTTYNTQLTGNVLDNDLGLHLELIDFNTTPNGDLNINSDGSFTYLPKPYFDGNETFSYTIRDEFNNTSTTTVFIVIYPPRADLSIVKTAPSESNVNEAIDYTLQIRSDPSTRYITASNVRVIDHLPPGVLYSGFSASSEWTCNHKVGTVTCDASNISRGYNGTIIIHAFTPNVLEDINNTAEVSSDTIDSNLNNNTSSAITKMRTKAVDLSITKTVSKSFVKKTESFSYTLRVNNTGSNDTTGVTVTDELNDTLGFISIDGGTDWSCSQGSSIVCNYTANAGVFVAGATANPIIIKVRAPSTIGSITNTAEVNSDTIEVNTDNNKANVNVNITDGNIEPGAQALTKYLQYNLSGDMKLIGNANLNKLPNDVDDDYNDRINMHYIDTDGDSSTFNSSSSTLMIDSSHKIKWAGLYWEGKICDDDLDKAQCIFDNSPYADFNESLPHVGTIKLKTPNSSTYQTISANTTYIIRPATYFPSAYYSAFADITNLLASNENGVYTVADIVAAEGKSEGGSYAGWTILLIYEDINQTMQYKNISVFNGFQSINSDGNDLVIDGFLTPKTAKKIHASVAFFTGDGDPVVGGVARMREGNTNTFSPIGDTLSPKNNLFNSTMTELGSYLNPGITKTYGVDADRIDVSDFMVNSQTNTAFKLDVKTPAGGVDVYTISMFAFATDLTSPLIDNFSKNAVIIDKDGTRRNAAPNAPIYPGSSLEYTITFTNTGDEVAEAVEIFDDFDIDGLSQALDNYHFDTTKLKLFNGTTTNDEVTNADCSYDILDHRVSCKIPSVDINQSFTMQFIVHIKEDLDASLLDTHAKNTAYAKYRNPNGNTYVKKYTTPVTNESVGGKSNALNAGIFKSTPIHPEKYIYIDAINNEYDYEQDRNITTKIVNSPFSIKLVHIDSNLTNSSYQAWKYKDGISKKMAVLITLENNATITTPLNYPSRTYFEQDQSNLTVKGLGLAHAHRDKRLKLLYLDWAKILSWAPSNSACLKLSDESTSLSSMPKCFNNYRYVEELFKFSTDPEKVAKCYSAPNNKQAPCDPNAYYTGGRPKGNISPAVYNHNFGCYQCIAESLKDFKHYSTDNFAARPDHFIFNSTNTSFPDLLRSGQEYNLSLSANDQRDINVSDYNLTNNDVKNALKLFYEIDPSNKHSGIQLDGNVTLNINNFNIMDGVAKDNQNNLDVLGFSFDNVGDVNITIYDPDWAIVDADDTPQDCNDTASVNNIPIEGVRSICGSVYTTFIPHHFALKSTLKNHREGNFTYYANELMNMSAHVGLTITAQNKQDKNTTNFAKDKYYNDISIDLNVTDENNTLNLKFNKKVPVLKQQDFKNGTYTIETNSSTPIASQILFDYNRTNNTPLNPVKINGTEVNTTITSEYKNAKAPEGNATITGTTLADGNATFYYARIRPAKDFYHKVTAAQKNTPVLIDVYCSLGYTGCSNLGIDTISGEFANNGLKWWLALQHDQTKNDGNITLSISGVGALNTTNVIITPDNDAEDDTIIVSPNNTPRPITVQIDLDTTNSTDTNKWLIYNPTSPFYQVEFIGNSNWTGHGDTGNVVGSDANRKENKRLGW